MNRLMLPNGELVSVAEWGEARTIIQVPWKKPQKHAVRELFGDTPVRAALIKRFFVLDSHLYLGARLQLIVGQRQVLDLPIATLDVLTPELLEPIYVEAAKEAFMEFTASPGAGGQTPIDMQVPINIHIHALAQAVHE